MQMQFKFNKRTHIYLFSYLREWILNELEKLIEQQTTNMTQIFGRYNKQYDIWRAKTIVRLGKKPFQIICFGL